MGIVMSHNITRSAYVFKPNPSMSRWSSVIKLVPEGDEIVESFGISVSMYDNIIAVGSPDWANRTGAVHIYERDETEWTEIDIFSPDELGENAYFGLSVSLHGNSPVTLAVGAPFDPGGGSAFVYTRPNDSDNWSYKKVVPVDLDEKDEFGSKVVLSGCTLAVSSPYDRGSSDEDLGDVVISYVILFDYDIDSNEWALDTYLEPENQVPGEEFGQCIEMKGDTLLVGSPSGGEYDYQLGTASGVVYHFERIDGIVSVFPC